MPTIPAVIETYYSSLDNFKSLDIKHEGAVSLPFYNLLSDWTRPVGLTVVPQLSIEIAPKKKIRPDATVMDSLKFHRGYWEAKDTNDDLELEIDKKIKTGYSTNNIIFEDTRRAVLYQNGQRSYVCDDMRDHLKLRRLLDQFVNYTTPQIENYHKAVAKFRQDIPSLALSLTQLIDETRQKNKGFGRALDDFLKLCRTALNPETSLAQVEDMLKQHILTERIFRSIFQNPDFVRRNVVAAQLEKVVDALTSQAFSRDQYMQKLDYFYVAIENSARTIEDYGEKQGLLNALYEQFFQAYSTRTADTHGIVYTPHEIVRWMLNSVQKALVTNFGYGLEADDVHIIDPCVGTGTFIIDLLQMLPSSALEQKFLHELHANEVQLLPYYIASQNIEHAFYDRMDYYEAFGGLCFADTLNIMDTPQLEMFAPANSERVEMQKKAKIQVVIGNPPYNMGQENENDNNKNRKHATVDKRINQTYAKDSKATLTNKLYDPYVKFFRWATDRLGGRDGIVCFVSNNSFVEQLAFDGMRKHLLEDFTDVYIFDLGGNVRKNPKLSGTKHNVFGIQVGVAITLLIRNKAAHKTATLHYARLDEFWTGQQKLKQLEKLEDYSQTDWQSLQPDNRYTWLTEGLKADFDTFLPMGTKEAKAAKNDKVESIFKLYSLGVATNRDNWAYDFDKDELTRKMKLLIDNYNAEVDRWKRRGTATTTNIDDFVRYDDKAIKWTDTLKARLERGTYIEFEPSNIRKSLYRPFSQQYLYFGRELNQRVYVMPSIFPTPQTEQENSVICVSSIGHRAPFTVLITNSIPNLTINTTDGTQCFPFYSYDEDGSNRRENLTDWALEKYQTHYNDVSITKWDIFYYVYAVLHAPAYRTAFAENLKRDLPRIGFVATLEDFQAYAKAGKELAHLHQDYTNLVAYPLKKVETPNTPLNWRVGERGMQLSKDRTSLRYNEWLSLENIPAKAFEYRLGNRSALEWVIDQYQVSTDARSNLRHDPNDSDKPQAIVKLVGQVITVSLETLAIIEALPPLGFA